MTKQQILDLILEHIERQPVRCTDDEGYPAYFNDDGHKDFVAAIFGLDTDDKVEKFLEHPPIEDVNILVFLRIVQKIHDEESPSDWHTSIRSLAAAHGLQYNEYKH